MKHLHDKTIALRPASLTCTLAGVLALRVAAQGALQSRRNAQDAAVAAVLERIRINGAARSADAERSDGKAGRRWRCKPEKRSLEGLSTSRLPMIAKRHQCRRYDGLAQSRPAAFGALLATVLAMPSDRLAA